MERKLVFGPGGVGTVAVKKFPRNEDILPISWLPAAQKANATGLPPILRM